MTILDETAQRVVVRIVYDGPARAGKTTNLKRLCDSLTPLRRGELFAPKEVGGRTVFFDWLQLEGGVVSGYRLRCQFVTVPGQAVLGRRRRLLLQSADAIVFVCDSTPKALSEAAEYWSSLQNFLTTSGNDEIPLLVQANKQDLESSLKPKEAAKALGVPDRIPVVGAAAEAGSGVRETAVLAIRAAADRAQAELLHGDVASLSGRAESGEDLYETIVEAEALAPMSPIETLARSRTENLPSRLEAPSEELEPPWPDPAAPSGCIWPTPGGRDTLRQVSAENRKRRDDLVGRPGTEDGSGKSDVVIFEAGRWCLKTSLRRRFQRSQDARAALVALARAKMRLDKMQPPATVLCVGAEEKGPHWLWTVSPWLTTLRATMSRSAGDKDEESLATALEAFARSAVDALVLAARRSIRLDIHPSNFALVEGEPVYIDDDIEEGATIPAIGHNLLQRVEEYKRFPGAVERYLQALETRILGHVSRDEVERSAVGESLDQTAVRSPSAREAKERIARVLGRCRVTGSSS